MNNIDLSKLNWAQGLNRIYNAVWAAAVAFALLHLLFDFGIHFIDWVLATIMFVLVPFTIKRALIWVIKGFVK